MSALVVALGLLWDWVPHVSLSGEHRGDLVEDGCGEQETKSVGLKKKRISISFSFFEAPGKYFGLELMES